MRTQRFQDWINEGHEPSEFEKISTERKRLRELGLSEDPMPAVLKRIQSMMTQHAYIDNNGDIQLTLLKYPPERARFSRFDERSKPIEIDITITEYSAPEGQVRILWSWLSRFGKNRPESRHGSAECAAIPEEVVKKLMHINL